MDTSGLSPVERDLVHATAEGRMLTCSNLDPRSLASSENERHVIRAEVIRDVLLGRHVDHPDPRGLRLCRARVTGTLDLDWLAPVIGLELSFCAVDEPITMLGARLPWLTLFGTHLPALNAQELHTDGSVSLPELRADADSERGAVRLYGAHIGGILDCTGAVLANKSGPALAADGLRVVRPVFFSDGFRAEADYEDAAVRLLGAHISELDCTGAVLANKSGPALAADRLQVEGSVFLRDGFRATGHGNNLATVLISYAQIGGKLDFRNSRIFNPDGLALDLKWSSADGLYLPGNVVCRSGAENNPQSWEDDGQLNLDGFTYSTLEPDGANLVQWLNWLRFYTPAYAAQPYQQLATIHRAAGDETATRRVLIAQQDDLLARGKLGSRRARAWHRFKRVTVGYGYQSWRALVGLTAVMVLAVALGLAAGHTPTDTGRFVAAHTRASAHSGTACSTVEQVGLGLELGLPAINTGITNRCDLDSTSHAGQVLTVLAWLLQAAAWAFATLVVVGYTGLIRKA